LAPSVHAPSIGTLVVFVLGETADTCCTTGHRM